MSQSPVFYAEGEDPKMVAAVQAARDTFKFYWRELSWEYRRIIPALDISAVKMAFPVDRQKFPDAPEVELMWVSDIFFDGRVVKGTLINQPNWMEGLGEGSVVESPLSEIFDWMYAINRVAFGGHTVQAMRAAMPDGDRAQHDAAWGLDFGDPEQVRLSSFAARGEDGEMRMDDNAFETDSGKLAGVEHPMSVNMKPKAIEMLTERPELLNGTDDEGWTYLQREALAGNATSVQVMLELGADKGITNPSGDTALDLAKKLGWPLVIELLQQ